jgi:hypothetical protein
MTMGDYIPKRDNVAKQWLTNFATVAQANATALGLTAGQATTLGNTVKDFATGIDDVESARNAYRGAVQSKVNARFNATKLVRPYAQRWMNSGTIAESLLAELGLPITPHTTSLEDPKELVAVGYSNGDNKLSWKRNGNRNGTVFVIEAKYGASTNWGQIDAVTSTRYTHSNQTPGTQVVYRVRARRGEAVSGYSNTAVVYAGEGSSTSFLSQAA